MIQQSGFILIFIVFVFIYGCNPSDVPDETQELVQVSTINALMLGLYDGTTSLDELSQCGDFGIGTFNSLDGEMIFLSDTFYQVKADGKIYRPAGNTRTPFATVTTFAPETTTTIKVTSFEQLKNRLDSITPGHNLFYAIRIRGSFEWVKTRSVPAQEKPYPMLVDVTASQPVFEITAATGILCGFYCPPYVTGINVPGYHLHFLTEDKTSGGHLLDFENMEGVVELDQVNIFRMILPTEAGFLESELHKDLHNDLKTVEGE